MEFNKVNKVTNGSMKNSNLIPESNITGWMKALRRCRDFDIYHTPQYQGLGNMGTGGTSYLFYFYNNFGHAALPFILRSVADVEGLGDSQINDITSAYGYPGIIASIKEDDKKAEEFRMDFQSALKKVFSSLSVVAFFSRTNPLLPTTWLFDGLAETISLSSTVAIDLALPEEKQLASMSKGHRYDIRKAKRVGVVVEEDDSFEHIEDFIEIYNETMQRNDADKDYYFSKEYYLQLKERFGDSIKLYFARHEGKTVSASMFFMTGQIIQYHLSGTQTEFLNLNGAKLILDAVRLMGTQKGFKWLHLGGGVGSSEDNLYRFKAGFSKVRLPFHIVKLVVDSTKYAGLVKQRKAWVEKTGCSICDSNFFPEYRKPYKSNKKM